ncbi:MULTISPECIES: hypothetical protein [unclassified Rhizobium]|uniref:hypothetical protein n=1 Tax=unclassified Rhizobium TaxID=2613769 RepID=UPI00115D31D7|nr:MULTISPECIES: hypothetical protein [unclassified Rhizobium]TQX88462.1 hypothetical protein EQW76_11545 [Rhizobium sp. rho-13.1]TQY12657.1 hypothetical protein EQW74_15190 [Rhizobium sp. rho-1.1]
MKSHATRLRDALGAADSYLHTLDMMADCLLSKGDSADYCAFILIIEKAKTETRDAHIVVDEMEEQGC